MSRKEKINTKKKFSLSLYFEWGEEMSFVGEFYMTREEDQVKEKFQRLLIVKSWEARFIVRVEW